MNKIDGFINCLKSISNSYQILGDNRYFAYQKAVNSINIIGKKQFKYNISNNIKTPYIGESITNKYLEYIKTGKIKKMEELMLNTTSNVHKNYMSRNEAKKLVSPLFKKLSNYSDDITYVGSYRREKDIVGDMDLLIIHNSLSFKSIFNNKKDDIIKVGAKKITILAIGDLKMKVLIEDTKTNKKIEVDLRIFKKSEKASALLYFTGSASENIKLRSLAKRKNLKLSEYGITTLSDNKLHHFKSEEAIYKFLGCTYKEPKER